jgi:hypothetical protein
VALARSLDLGNDVAVGALERPHDRAALRFEQLVLGFALQACPAARAPAEIAPARLGRGVVRRLLRQLGEGQGVLAGALLAALQLFHQRLRLRERRLVGLLVGVFGSLTRISRMRRWAGAFS